MALSGARACGGPHPTQREAARAGGWGGGWVWGQPFVSTVRCGRGALPLETKWQERSASFASASRERSLASFCVRKESSPPPRALFGGRLPGGCRG